MIDIPYYPPELVREIEEEFDANKRVWELMAIITAEFESDPMSVQCFDSLVVQEAVDLVRKKRKMRGINNPLRKRNIWLDTQ